MSNKIIAEGRPRAYQTATMSADQKRQHYVRNAMSVLQAGLDLGEEFEIQALHDAFRLLKEYEAHYIDRTIEQEIMAHKIGDITELITAVGLGLMPWQEAVSLVRKLAGVVK